ncbi:MAG TPA: FMN-binding negative transcriptional regulator [Sphingomicrobium sp.]|jgi:transcriptional regulator|nr:FMN-binding negative transcriptional regulator [Sphingomicrobium sp.]
MHPNRAFEWTDSEEMLRFVEEHSFAHIFTAGGSGDLFVVHAPVIVAEGRVQFHVSRRNRIADRLAGNSIIISVSGRQAYQSANWYASENQVPTWHYEAVEIEGPAREMRSAELVGFLDRLSDIHERRVQPDNPWTRDKMAQGKFEALTRAIAGFEVVPIAIRGTRKFNQHKEGEDLAATIDGQMRAGRTDIVAAVRELRAGRE